MEGGEGALGDGGEDGGSTSASTSPTLAPTPPFAIPIGAQGAIYINTSALPQSSTAQRIDFSWILDF